MSFNSYLSCTEGSYTKTQHILFILCIGAVLLASGCIGGNSGSNATPTPVVSVAVTHIATINHPATPTPNSGTQVSTGPVETFDINGTVRDYVGNPEANAVVTLMQNGQRVSISGVSNPQFSSDGNTTAIGSYIFQNVPKGKYQIIAVKNGFTKSIWYPDDGTADIFLPNMPGATPVPTKLAGPTVNTGGYVCSFTITRESDGDVVITNDGGADAPYVTSVQISFTDKSANTVGPLEPNKLTAYGVSGDLLDMGSQVTIPSDYIASYSHVVVYAVFNKPPATVSKQIMKASDV